MTIANECLAALRASAAPLPLSTTLLRQRSWASALFVGERLCIAVDGTGGDREFTAWLDALPSAELPLRRYFVASADIVRRDDRGAVLELLVVED